MRRLLSAILRGATKPVALGIALTISLTSFQAVADPDCRAHVWTLEPNPSKLDPFTDVCR